MLREVLLRAIPDGLRDTYPFRVPTIASLKRLRFTSRVVFLSANTGAEKRHCWKAIALSSGLAFEGGSRNFRVSPRPAFGGQSQEVLIEGLADAIFLRAESFYNVVSYLEGLDDPRAFAPDGGASLHTRSHGESFMTLFIERFAGGGLDLIDEPEAALSAARQLALLVRMHDLLEASAETQFIVATHSPIVEVPYKQTDAYASTRRFLDNPERRVLVAVVVTQAGIDFSSCRLEIGDGLEAVSAIVALIVLHLIDK